MSHGYAGDVVDFLKMEEDTLIGRLIYGVGATGANLYRNTQIRAWHKQIQILRSQLSDPVFRESLIVLVYELPRRFWRPYVVLLHEGVVFGIELKIGARTFPENRDTLQSL